MDGWMNGRMDGCMDGWMDGQMDRWTDGQIDKNGASLREICSILGAPFIHPSKSQADDTLPVSPAEPLWKDMPVSRASSAYPSGSPAREPSLHLCLQNSPKNETSYKMGKNIRSPSTEPHADVRPTHSGVWPDSPRGSLTTLLSPTQCHAALVTIPSTLACVEQSPVSQSLS